MKKLQEPTETSVAAIGEDYLTGAVVSVKGSSEAILTQKERPEEHISQPHFSPALHICCQQSHWLNPSVFMGQRSPMIVNNSFLVHKGG